MTDNRDFTTGSIPKKLILFMLPTLLALILQAAYSAVDLLIVGQFGTTAGGISGVSNGANIMHSVTVIISALTTGVTVLIGQYLGQRRSEKIGGLIGSAVCFFLVLSLGLTVLLTTCAETGAQETGIENLLNYYTDKCGCTEERAVEYVCELFENGTIDAIMAIGKRQP